MERLTSREPRISGMPGVCCTHFEGGDCQAIQGHCADGCAWEEAAWERLAAYEDTGLEPEDIDALQKRERGLAEMLVNVSCGCVVPYTRLAELAQAEKDGMLVVLPPNDPLTLEQLRAMDGEPVWGADGQCYIVNVKAGYAVDKDRGFRMLWSNGFFYRRKREEEDNETD